MDSLESALQQRLGKNLEIVQIRKGFSTEQKYQVTAAERTYLVRVSHTQSFVAKRQEFDQMKDLCDLGVQCNKPIDLFADDKSNVIGIYSYLPGADAEDCIAALDPGTQYQIGVASGRDLKIINSVIGTTRDWKERKWAKHERYVREYIKQNYRFEEDEKVLKFIATHYGPDDSGSDRLQHDDFHLGNIIVNNGQYAGVLDFNRYDWGDPLHEFVKLEWFSWPISPEYSLGQVAGYFAKAVIDDTDCEQIAVYVAMSIVSSIVWTLKFWPDTWMKIEPQIRTILHHYNFFDSIRPQWAS